MRKALFCCIGGLLGCLGVMPAVMAQTAVEELQERITEQEKEIERLKKKDRQLEQQMESTTSYVEKTAATAGGRSRTTIGGYGELHYNDWENQKDDSDFSQIDFHRFVLFFGHEFTDRLRFFSELELEHALAGDGKEGEVELEQAVPVDQIILAPCLSRDAVNGLVSDAFPEEFQIIAGIGADREGTQADNGLSGLPQPCRPSFQ